MRQRPPQTATFSLLSSPPKEPPLRRASPPVKRDSAAWLSDLGNVFWKLVEPVAGSVAPDQVVIAKPIEIAAMDIGRMNDDVHVLLDRHGLILIDQGTFHHIVALAMTIKARLDRTAILAHEVVERVPNILTGRAGLEHVQRKFA